MTRDLVLRSPGERLAARLPHRTVAVVLGLALALAAAMVSALCLGSRATPLGDVLEAVVAPARSDIALIVNAVRMPRVLLAVLVGAALAVAGLILQAIVRNPLASPDILGVTSGASAAAVAFLSFHGGDPAIAWLPVVAMGGAAAVALVIVVLAWRGGVTPGRLVLVGVGIAAAMSAVTTLVVVLNPEITTLRAYVWLIGSLYAAQWREVLGVLPWFAFPLPVVLGYARHMDALALGDGVATGLGVDVARARLVLLAASVALAGAAVAFAGGIGFVGLMAPHIARRLTHGGFAGLVLASSLIGGLMVLGADVLGRVAFLPRDLPAGIFVAGIGAPFFVYLLHRSRR